MRYWDGSGWLPYGWRGSVELDPLGLAPTPGAGERLVAAFGRNRLPLAVTAAAAVLILLATIFGASRDSLAGDFFTWAILPAILLANLADRWRWVRWVAFGFALLACLLLVVISALSGGGDSGYDWLIWLLGATGIASLLVPRVRRLLARFIPIDPTLATHTLALQMTVGWLASWAWTQASHSALDSSGYMANGMFDAPLSDLPLLAAGVFGVGFLIRRDWRATLTRLALVKPSFSQVVAAVVIAEVMTWIAVGADWLVRVLTPETAKQLDSVGQVLYGGYGSQLLPWVLLAAGAGICEEVLFRGALQPRLGLPATALLFASTHVQYGLSIILGLVVLAGFVLGFLRRYSNTTTTIVCHLVYDILAGLTFPLSWFLVGCLLQLPVVAYLLWRRRVAALSWLRGRPVRLTPAWIAG